MQSALNAIWKVRPRGETITHFMIITRLMKTRAASLGLVAALGVPSAGIIGNKRRGDSARHLYQRLYPVRPTDPVSAEFRDFLRAHFRLIRGNLQILPDTPLAWRDVVVGAGRNRPFCSRLESR